MLHDHLGADTVAACLLRDAHVSLPETALPGHRPGTAQSMTDSSVAAVTGQFTDIQPVRELFGLSPVFTALPLASTYAGVHAATAAVLCLREQEAGRPVARIEAPLSGAALSAMSSLHLNVAQQPERYDAPRLPKALRHVVLPLLRRYARRNEEAERKVLDIAGKSYPALMTSYPCADRALLYVFAVDNAKIARRLVETLGLEEHIAKAGLSFGDPYAREGRDDLSEASNLTRHSQRVLKTMITDALASRPALAWEDELNAAGVPCAVQRTLAEWAALPELREAGVIRTKEDGTPGPGPMVWQTDGPVPPEPTPATPSTAARPASTWLSGTRVIDLCSMVAGPVATRTLAEYGAEVIKVEPPCPSHGPRLTCWYALDTGQGKRSTLIDLSTPGGRDAMERLIDRADVLVTNHSGAALDALELSDADLKTRNPRLIRCRISAYGGPRPGPWDDRPGYDPVLQAASGIMVRYGDPGAPELHAIASCVDALTGYAAAFAVAGALRARDQDGQGRAVATSLAAAATLIQAPLLSDTLPDVGGQTCRGTTAMHHLYRAKGGWLFLDAPDREAAELPFRFRPSGRENPRTGIARRIRRTRLANACATLSEAGFPAVPVQSVQQLRDEWLAALPETVPRLVRRDIPGVGPVVTAPPCQVLIDGMPLEPLAPAEKPGASTRAVLTELGLDADWMIAEGAAAEQLADAFLPG